jgi:hypothetical protein
MMEVTVEAPENLPRPEWQGVESAIQSRVLEVATHRPHDKAITIADSFETIGITVTDVRYVNVQNDDPEYSDARRQPDIWYRGEVESCAQGVIDELLAMPADERAEALGDLLHEAIDSRHCIIATAEARMVLAVSSNYDAMEEQFGDDSEATWEQLAYWAMHTDVRDRIDSRRDEWHPNDMPDDGVDDDGTDPRNPGVPFRNR